MTKMFPFVLLVMFGFRKCHSVVSEFLVTPWTVDHQPGSPARGILQAWSTGAGGHFLLQGLFTTQGLNSLGRWVLYHWAIWEAPSEASLNIEP